MNRKQEKLVQWLNQVGKNAIEYQQHKDNINNILECCIDIGNIYLDNCSDEIKAILKQLIDKNGIDFLWDNDLIIEQYTHGIYSIDNELWSFNIGEIEEDFKDIYEYNSTTKECFNKFESLTQGMTENAIKECYENCEYCISDNGYMYIDLSHDRISVILNEEKFLEYFKANYMLFSLLSVDAWNDSIEEDEYNWSWNNWYYLKRFIVLPSNIKDSKIIQFLVKENYLTDNAKLKETIELLDDGYNIQLCDIKENSIPIMALCYGEYSIINGL